MHHSINSGEGVQVGSVCSPFGVLGAWTTANHDPYDPVGASYYHPSFSHWLIILPVWRNARRAAMVAQDHVSGTCSG